MEGDFDVDAMLEAQMTGVKGADHSQPHRNGARHERKEGHSAQDTGHRKSKERDPERDRSRDRERHRSKDRDRDSDRDRRERDRHRDKRPSSRDRDREPRRPEERRKSRDRDDERGRHRSRDRDDAGRHRSRDREDDGGRHRSRDREGEQRKLPPPPGDLRGGREDVAATKRPRTPTPERELRNMQRMACTVMAMGISVMADEFDVFEFFSQAGELADVKLIRDKHSSRHKGIAYIEYAERADVLNALRLNGQQLKGMTVTVKPSEAEKNFAWETQELQKRQYRQTADPQAIGLTAGGPAHIRVDNIPTEGGLTEDDVRPIFEAFGAVQELRFERDAMQHFTGTAFVVYPTAPEGRKAVLGLEGNDALGAPLRLKTLDELPPDPSAAVAVAAAAAAAGTYAGELDEGDASGGMRLNASARTALMGRMSGAAELVASREALPPPPPRPPPSAPQAPTLQVDEALQAEKGLVGAASPAPTACLLLKNMFDPATEEGAQWPQEVEEDVRDECSKFGPVDHIHVDPVSRGFVYLKFASEAAAVAAQKALHGRWYSHRQILASFQFTQLYNRHFGLQ